MKNAKNNAKKSNEKKKLIRTKKEVATIKIISVIVILAILIVSIILSTHGVMWRKWPQTVFPNPNSCFLKPAGGIYRV